MKGFINFLKSINLKVNLITWLEFELAIYFVAMQHIRDYATGNPLLLMSFSHK